MNQVIEIEEQKQKRLKHKSNPLRSADAYRLMELIEEERLVKDQLADFWEPRFSENRRPQHTVLT
jgi:23S rRNA U2552 (ribose-2'-O)-methylase RlmE/FtsJ